MAQKKKYYVVWNGHRPGIYNSWEECQKQINGFPAARYRSFADRAEAEKAFKHPETVQPKSSKKQYYYVVWHGHKPGIYTKWEDVLDQIRGFQKPIYKTFGSKSLAEKAFNDHPDKYADGNYKKTKELTAEQLKKIGTPLELSLCVDAACNGKGDFEYQGVWTFNRETVFRVGPYKKGSNNIGEFLALVHALAYLNQQRDEKMKKLPIYSDSRIAMSWVRQKVCRTNKKPAPDVQRLIGRAEKWLKENNYSNPILKWETKVWGEIPADFGRK